MGVELRDHHPSTSSQSWGCHVASSDQPGATSGWTGGEGPWRGSGTRRERPWPGSPRRALQSLSGPASVVPRCGPSRWCVVPPGLRPVVPVPPQASAAAAPTPALSSPLSVLVAPLCPTPPSPRKASTFSLSEIKALFKVTCHLLTEQCPNPGCSLRTLRSTVCLQACPQWSPPWAHHSCCCQGLPGSEPHPPVQGTGLGSGLSPAGQWAA